jgi:hypothetical protein
MSRFLKVFLRDQLGGRLHVAGFGKHPAWDDHIDDIGLETETLVIAKQLLYSQGIAGQLASGAWDQLEKTSQSLDFDHRFIWARKGQALVGTILASIDGKGRARFPMVVCLQAEMSVLQAILLYLPFVESLGKRCQAAVSRQDFRELLNLASGEPDAFPAFPDGHPVSAHPEFQEDDFLVHALEHLSEALRRSKPSRFSGGNLNKVSFRLPAISVRTPENLEFWTGYLESWVRLQVPYLALASIGRLPVDVIVGEPSPTDFFCLRAKETVLPLTRTESPNRQAAGFQPAAGEYLLMFKQGSGADTRPRRSWWPGSFGKLG